MKYIVEYFSAIERNKMLLYATKMDELQKLRQAKEVKLTRYSRKGKNTVTKN